MAIQERLSLISEHGFPHKQTQDLRGKFITYSATCSLNFSACECVSMQRLDLIVFVKESMYLCDVDSDFMFVKLTF